MTNVAKLSTKAQRDYDNIVLYEDLYKIDATTLALSLTEEGKRYYGAWFLRFGFTLDESDPEHFFGTVRFINRQLWDRTPLSQQLANESLDPQERALWEAFSQGRHDDFARQLNELARRAACDKAQVLAFPTTKAKG